mgnify:CR=1 FL=1
MREDWKYENSDVIFIGQIFKQEVGQQADQSFSKKGLKKNQTRSKFLVDRSKFTETIWILHFLCFTKLFKKFQSLVNRDIEGC